MRCHKCNPEPELVIFRTDLFGRKVIGIARVVTRFRNGGKFITLSAERVKHTPFNYDNVEESKEIVSSDYLKKYENFTIFEYPYTIPYDSEAWDIMMAKADKINQELSEIEVYFR